MHKTFLQLYWTVPSRFVQLFVVIVVDTIDRLISRPFFTSFLNFSKPYPESAMVTPYRSSGADRIVFKALDGKR